jgi:transposase
LIGSSRRLRVFARTRPTDLRKGFNGLYGLVLDELELDPTSGDLYLFVNRRRTLSKVLLWDGTGLCLFIKRLDRGRFAELWRDSESRSLRLTKAELDLYLEGCKMVGKTALSPPEIVHEVVDITDT